MKAQALRILCLRACWPLPWFSILYLRRVIAIIVVLTLGGAVASSLALAQRTDPKTLAQKLTQSLITLNTRLKRANAMERQRLLDGLLKVAIEREQLLM